ncbi:hypothetical protein IKG28_02705 [Candidatus Saccharibacteria bacterium]|nr:hypothetical protein [Candidatus Saccharibacteria bacterium]MBR3332511.1 hypothetical protein [Candidatus Saccharibacteria bacterium]
MGGRIKIKKFKIKTWQLLVILVPMLFIDATLMRQDHIKMTELRDAVMTADEAGNEEEIVENLTKLRQYVASNIVINIVDDNGAQKIMFGTGPFYLEHSYLKAANKALEEAEAKMSGDNNPYGNVYGQAGEVCRAQALQYGWTWDNVNFINCMLTEIGKYPAADEIQDTIIASLPSTELYRHNYASPIWAPTFTGFMLLFTLIIVVVIFIRMIIWVVLRLYLLFA